MDTLCSTACGNFNVLDFYNLIHNEALSSAWSSMVWLPQKLLEGRFGFVSFNIY